MSYTISQVRQAVLDRLKDPGSPVLSVAKTIDFYHGEVQAIADQAASMAINFPAALVLYGGSTYEQPGNQYDNFQVLVVYIAKDARGGIYLQEAMDGLLEAGKTQLNNGQLSLDIWPLLIKSTRMVRVTREFSIYTQQFETKFTM